MLLNILKCRGEVSAFPSAKLLKIYETPIKIESEVSYGKSNLYQIR